MDSIQGWSYHAWCGALPSVCGGLQGRLNVEKAAVVGHSMGGASAIASTALSDAFKANVILDGWFYPIENGLYAKCSNRPTLMLNASTWQWAANVRRMLKLDADGRTERILLTMK